MGLFLSFLLSFGTLGALDVTGLSINTETIVSDGFTILTKFMPLFLLCGSIAIVYLFGDFFVNIFRKLRR